MDADQAPTAADEPAIEEARRAAHRTLKLERNVLRDLLLARGWTLETLARQVAQAREGRRK